MSLHGQSSDPNIPGVLGDSTTFNGVRGTTTAPGQGGVAGISDVHNPDPANHPENNPGPGVYGQSDGTAVWGESTTWVGVYGHSNTGHGVWGESLEGTGTIGIGHKGPGVHGKSVGVGHGVLGEHTGNGIGTAGTSVNGVGVWGGSETFEAVHAETKSPVTAAIAAYNLNPDGTGAGIYAKKVGVGDKAVAGFFEGDVVVTGDIKLLGGNDVAENFSVTNFNSAFPGCVMTFKKDGSLEVCNKAYDKRAAGVISGAGDYKPGLILGKKETEKDRMPIALMGKVFCMADADFGAIEVGDLLTTSSTTGHAMKASEPYKAFGAVIGKALKSLDFGKGLIPILVTLQ